jgi:hypothetical protein
MHFTCPADVAEAMDDRMAVRIPTKQLGEKVLNVFRLQTSPRFQVHVFENGLPELIAEEQAENEKTDPAVGLAGAAWLCWHCSGPRQPIDTRTRLGLYTRAISECACKSKSSRMLG